MSMNDVKTVPATLDVEIIVECPNDECGTYIDILKEGETNGFAHNEESFLIRQVWPAGGKTNEDFECEGITCSECQTIFNVKTLDW